jgi:sulfite exporter TauE/SafE
MLFGGIVLWLGTNIPPRMEKVLELAVSVMLIALGIDVLRRLRLRRIHFHVHHHDQGGKHVHAHSHAGEDGNAHSKHHRHEHHRVPPLRALAVGMMHGMAGSAALVALSLGAVSSWFMGVVYIAIFGLGSIAGMALLSVVITIPLRWSAANLGQLHRNLTALVGGFSCTLGAFVFYRIGVLEGLLFS